MSIAGVYVQIVDGKERYKSFTSILKSFNVDASLNQIGTSDVQLSASPCQDHRPLVQMAPKSPSKSETFANRVRNFFGAPLEDRDVQPQEPLPPQPAAEAPAKVSAFSFTSKLQKRNCCKDSPPWCCGLAGNIIYVVLSVFTVFEAVALIVVGGVVAVAVRAYDTEHTGKAAALALLVLSAGLTIALVIWSAVALFKRQGKQTKKLALFLFLLPVFQLVLTLTAISPSARSQQRLTEDLAESFQKAREGNQRHVKQWAATQHGLSCCGLNDPEDYRSPNLPLSFPPEVPISCCRAFDPNRPALTQERQRVLCNARKQYYRKGCADPLATYFAEAGIVVTSLVTGLFFIEIFLALWNFCWGRRLKPNKFSDEAPELTIVSATPATFTA